MSEFDELLGPVNPLAAPAAPPVTVTVPTGAGGDLAMGAYEGANRFDQTLALWSPALRSADADILPEKDLLDARSRDMVRNDAYIQGGANLHKDSIVGSQFLLNARPITSVLFGSENDAWEEAFQQEVEAKFDLWAESPDNWVDAARTNNFTSLIRMAVGIHLMAGEVLASVEFVKDGPFRTAVQMIDLDRLTTAPLSMMDQNVRAGVRYDQRGAPVAYQIRTQHPYDISWQMRLPEWKEVPIRKPWGRLQMIHLFEQLRPDQSRGVAEMAAALKEMRMSHKWRDVNLQNAVLRATYAAAITSELPSETVFAQLGGGNVDPAKVQEAITAYAQGYLGSIAEYAGNAKNLHVDGVKVPHLYPGTKFELLAPAAGGPLGGEFEQSLLRYLAAALGVSYEQLSRDYTNTNYSSARAAMSETWKFMQARKKLIADRFATIIFRLWLEEAINNDHLKSFPKSMAGMLYSDGRLNLNFEAISRCEWIGASRGQIDELKETQAAVLRIQNGLSTAEDELARLGKDWRKVYRQLKRELALRESMGLIITPTEIAMNLTNDSGENDDKPADTKKKEAA